MKNWLYGLYALILGVVSYFTGEIITFVMLGLILISLHNINATLKRIHKNKNEN